jgi:hypothetical protein
MAHQTNPVKDVGKRRRQTGLFRTDDLFRIYLRHTAELGLK